MAEKDKSPPDEELAPSRLDTSSIAIEEAETDIKEAAKEAAYKNLGKNEYYRKVNAILKKRLARVRSPTLLKSALLSLLRLAQKQYEDELKLVKLYAEWFRMVSEAKAKGMPDAPKLYNAMIKEVGGVRGQIGFQLAVVGGGAPVVQTRSDITSSQVLDSGADPSAYNVAMPLAEHHATYLKRVEELRNQLINAGAVDDGGLSLRNIAEMTVRYEHQQQMITELRNNGTKLVYIEPHANCSKRCAKYQVGGSKHPSGLYSLDGSEGVTPEDHIKYRPLEFATNNPADQYTTQSGKTYQNGCILGYNCRHRLIPYKPHTQPIPIPKRVIENRRRVETTQREMERDIRHMRGALLQATTTQEKTKLKGLIKAAEDKYINFSRQNKVAYYIRRTEIF